MNSERRQRLLDELNGMRQLADSSSIIFFESVGEAPDFYKVKLKGRLVTRESSVSAVRDVEEHSCDIRLPFSFPETPPDIRFTSTVYHPNISSGGFVDLAKLGFEWTADLSLAVVCERLWDACRLAIYNVEGCTNVSAGEWMTDECQMRLPLDERPLRDQADKSCSNVIQYKRRDGSRPRELSAGDRVEPDILFIGEDPAPAASSLAPRESATPPKIPPAPARQAPSAARPPVSRPAPTPAPPTPAPPTPAATGTPVPPSPPAADSARGSRRERPQAPAASDEEIFYIGDDETGEH